VPGTQIEIEIGLERYYAVAARTFADVRRGDIVLYEDSYRNIAIAINEGDAAAVVSARAGDEVRIRPRD
jgi:S-adenosylmethionine hydrolase